MKNEIDWNVDMNEANYLIGLIAKRPIEEALGIYNKLIQQANAPKPEQVAPEQVDSSKPEQSKPDLKKAG